MIKQKKTKIKVDMGNRSQITIDIDNNNSTVTIGNNNKNNNKTSKSYRKNTSIDKKSSVLDDMKRLDSTLIGILKKNKDNLTKREIDRLDNIRTNESMNMKRSTIQDDKHSFSGRIKSSSRKLKLSPYIHLHLNKNTSSNRDISSSSKLICSYNKGITPPISKKFPSSIIKDSQIPHTYYVRIDPTPNKTSNSRSRRSYSKQVSRSIQYVYII